MSEASTMETAPRTGWLTPFNVIAGIILAGGAVILAIRFTFGLASVTNLTHTYPWGLWIGFDVMSGVALAAGGFVTSTAVYLFGMKEYRSVVRPALLTGFLGYVLVVLGLIADLGRPWHLPYPFIRSAGPTSALFEVSLCVALYLTVLLIESTPAFFEWLGLKWWRRLVGSLTIVLTVFGLLLSTLHQSTLGAMFMVTPTKLHPLWYTSHIPVHFFISAVAAGIGMVIVEGMFSHRAFKSQIETSHEHHEKMTLGLAKGGAVTLMIYFSVKVMNLALENEWSLLLTGWGAWYLVELLGFVLLPCLIFMVAYREQRPSLARTAAVITVIGVVLNRLNVSMIAFNWNQTMEAPYVPHWMEVWVSVALVTLGVVVFRWIAMRMPIMYEHPEWKGEH
jgi:Ni/Fe-hydrogenase subunit HybB-like protein